LARIFQFARKTKGSGIFVDSSKTPDPFECPGSGTYQLNHGRGVKLAFENEKKWRVGQVELTSAGIAIAAVAERGLNEQYVKNLCAGAEKAVAKTEYGQLTRGRG
jgi:hypothetical protein